MKIKNFITIFLVTVFITGSSFSQDIEYTSEDMTSRRSRSIHQIEWEQYREYKLKEEPPALVEQPRDLIPKSAPPSCEIFGYLPYWRYSSYATLNYDLLTTIAYFGINIDEFGNITNFHDWPATALINKAHSEGVRVVLTVILFSSNNLGALLSDPARRSNLVNNLLTQVQIANADGVTIDFEGVPSGQKQNLTNFMAELTSTFHNNIPGSFVTIFTPAVDWSNVYDYLALSQITDGLVMQGYDYHWSTAPTAGPVAPLTGDRWGFPNVTWTVNDYLSKTMSDTTKLILSVPFYGFEWITVDDGLESQTIGDGDAIFYSAAYPNALQYGRLWDEESQTPWYKYNDGQWHQGWYDDSLSLGLKFNLVNDLDLKGIAIWALGYDGSRQELQGAISDAFGSLIPPLRPTQFRIANIGTCEVGIAVSPAVGATSYKLYKSLDGEMFDSGTEYPNSTMLLSNLSPDTTYYYKVSAVNGNGESNLTEVLAVSPSIGLAELLIVNGFDRTSGTVNTFDYIKRFAPALVKTGYAFDACANEAVEDGTVSLLDYDIVLWISGEEGTDDESFSGTEQAFVAEYLENGGKLFVSGSEIGWDLVGASSSSNADKTFYQTYLKAQYVVDDAASYSVVSTAEGIFNHLLTIFFDNGAQGTYNVDYPDGIKPVGGAVQCLNYNGVNPTFYGGAGIQYAGIFGQGTVPGKLVYLGVGFETFYPESNRDSIMARIIRFFEIPAVIMPLTDNSILPDDFRLFQNYPNPFNPSTTISYSLSNASARHIRLKIFNILGQEMVTLVDSKQLAGDYKVVWNGLSDTGDKVPSGVYIYWLQVGDRTKFKKMTLVR